MVYSRAVMADIRDTTDSAGGTIFPLLLTVFTSIFEVFLLCFAGYVLAWRGILDKPTTKQINRLNIALFTPSLVFSKVALFLSPDKLKELWVIPIFFVLVTTVSMSVAFLLATIFGATRTQRNFSMAAGMFPNSNSLPVALMQSLVITIPALKWGPDDNKNAMVGRALTYLLLYSTLGMVLRWSVGWQLLTSKSGVPHGPGKMDGEEETSALVSHEIPLRGVAPSSHRSYNWFPKSPNDSGEHLALSPAIESGSTSAVVSEFENDEIAPLSQHAAELGLLQHVRHPSSLLRGGVAVNRLRSASKCVLRALMVLNDFMTAPLWAALASILVACVGPLQQIFENDMQPVKGALSRAGNCSIPTTLVVLGAYFYPPPLSSSLDSEEKHTRPGSTPDDAHPGETKTVVIAIVTRMIVAPLLLLPLIALCAQYDWQPIFTDPVFVVSMVLLVSSPPALTLAQISQAASGEAVERLISRTIFWSYCIVTPLTIIAYAVVSLKLAEL
ncbi:auxin efflux carrier [Mycena capillaripes]|nr:auxin efflux carrier [Mycena capillaripes]